jgi:DNA mismatch repair ATPase MutL
MAFKVDIPEKYKSEFPFMDDSQAMEKLSFESFKKTVDDHIKKLHKNELLAFRNEYQKRMEFVRSQLKHSANNRELKNCDLCYSYCVERAYHFIQKPELLKADRLPKECIDKINELCKNHSALGVNTTFEKAFKCKACRYEIVDGEKKEIGSYSTLRRRVKKYYPDLYERTAVQK